MDERALSDVVGYVLIFGLVLLTATGAVALGSSGLMDIRDVEQVNNAEAAFDILAENVDDHVHSRATGRSTELKVADANLYFGDRESTYVNVTPAGGGTTTTYYTDGEPIVYESRGGSKIVYSNGALFREDGDGSYMFREPEFRIGENRTVLSQTEIRGNDAQLSVRGSRTVLIRTEQRTPRLYQNASADEYDVTIEILTDDVRADTWKEYLESHAVLEGECGIDDSLPDGNAAVECDYSTAEIYVPVTRLNAEIT